VLLVVRLAWVLTLASCTLETDIPYAEVAGESVQLDVAEPWWGGDQLPGLLVLHGGSWRSGDKSSQRAMIRYLVR
jgi:acetyl esterase/lipase